MGEDRRLHRCIRDLAALNALPSMCIGRSPEETVDIIVDALPTALSSELVYLWLPGTPPAERATLRGAPLPDAAFGELRLAFVERSDGAGDGPRVLEGCGDLWLVEAAVPLEAGSGRLVVGRTQPPDPETDRVLVRSAANVVGATLESARILEIARRKDDFLAMLGHELRNPLAPILTASELLAYHPEVAREQQVIERQTRHLARLVDDLLDISRVTRGHVELRNQQVSLASVIERGVEIVNPLVSRYRHTLTVGDPGDVTLRGDPVRLAQVFGNLLCNAAKFTPPGGRIDIGIERLPQRVRVTVTDTGRGIARDQLRRIFEPFVQADRERDSLRGGLGLGLAIVQNLVERHGGAISARSAGRGEGAIFTVELPTVAGVAEAPAVQSTRASGERVGVRVLVVDDNADLAEVLSEALRAAGFQTAVEHDARSALERWRSFAPHAAILDVGLPHVDGYELAKTLRAEHGSAPTLIAATGYGEERDKLRSADAGFDCHLVKPVSLRDLLLLLDQRVVARAPAATDAR